MRYKGKHFKTLPKKSTPKAKTETEHIPSTPLCFTAPGHRYPATNLAMPTDEGVEEGREFVEENIK